jgi:hypothetical protein
VNRDSFISSLPICIPFISSSCLIAFARNFKSGDSGHFCLVPDFTGNVFSFSPLSLMVCYRFVLYSLYYVELHSFHS